MTRRATPVALPFAAACAGIALYTAMDAVIKQLSIASGAYAAVLWRAWAGVAIAGSVYLRRRRRWPGGAALRLHLLRGAVGCGSMLCFFWGLARVPMAKAVALTFLAPLIAVFLSALWLGERVRPAALAGTLVAGAGVLAIAVGEAGGGGTTDQLAGAAAIVVASVLYAGSLTLLRAQAQVADPLEVTLFTMLVMAVLLLPGGVWFVGWPAWPQTPAIALAAGLGTISSLLMAWAYARAQTQVVASVEYTAFIWAALFGWLVFGERVSGWTVAGALLIVAGCGAAVRKPAPMPQTEAAG